MALETVFSADGDGVGVVVVAEFDHKAVVVAEAVEELVQRFGIAEVFRLGEDELFAFEDEVTGGEFGEDGFERSAGATEEEVGGVVAGGGDFGFEEIDDGFAGGVLFESGVGTAEVFEGQAGGAFKDAVFGVAVGHDDDEEGLIGAEGGDDGVADGFLGVADGDGGGEETGGAAEGFK